MCVGGGTTKSQMIITCQGFTIVLCETLRVSLPPLSGLGFQILQSVKVCEGTLQIVGGMLGNPAKNQPPMFMTFPTNSGLTLMSKWDPIYHPRPGKWPFFLGFAFFSPQWVEIQGDLNVLCSSFCNLLTLNVQKHFEIRLELSQTNKKNKCHIKYFLCPFDPWNDMNTFIYI